MVIGLISIVHGIGESNYVVSLTNNSFKTNGPICATRLGTIFIYFVGRSCDLASVAYGLGDEYGILQLTWSNQRFGKEIVLGRFYYVKRNARKTGEKIILTTVTHTYYLSPGYRSVNHRSRIHAAEATKNIVLFWSYNYTDLAWFSGPSTVYTVIRYLHTFDDRDVCLLMS